MTDTGGNRRTTARKGARAAELPLGLRDAPVGRVERATAAAVRHAQRAGNLTAEHAGLAATLRALARSLDAAERKGDPYAAAQAGRVLLDALERARLTPSAEEVAHAPLADLLTLGAAHRHADPAG